MGDKDPIDFMVIERGKWFRDQIADSESHFGWIYHQIGEAISSATMAHCDHRYHQSVEPLDYKLGRLHGLRTFREYADSAVEDGEKEAIRFAENRENRPADADGPRRG